MPVTPRRSTRSNAVFTPTAARVPLDATYEWNGPGVPAAPIAGPSSARESSPPKDMNRVDYTAFTRTRRREELHFEIGDGVVVALEGGNEGIGVVTALYEEDADEDDEDEEERKRMASVHWFFRRSDLPSVMRSLQLEENEVLLATSQTRSVTTELPLGLLLKTVPVYSPAVYEEKHPAEERKTIWTGYARPPPAGVYWCARACDKSVRGGKLWNVDVEEWVRKGREGSDWEVVEAVESESEEEEGQVHASESSGSEAEAGDAEDEDEDDEMEGLHGEEETVEKKRKRPTSSKRPTKRASKSKGSKKAKVVAVPAKKKVHPTASVSRLPRTVAIESLPADPYERALRLLHVGATPESLPCREDEFVDVLSRVEEGVESGGGGCLYIAGVPGTGKTATVHAVVKELKRKAEDGELAPFSYVEINGLKIPSPQHAYSVLWEAISGQAGTSAKTALRGLEAHFGRKGGGARGPRGHTFVVLMDELDQLLTAKQDVVYNFFNWPTMRDSQVFVVAIANRMDLPQHLAAKIKSRLGLQTLLFQPYDRASLIQIVQSRLVPHPLSTADHNVLSQDAITLAATKMAGTNGDARRVLDACRRAVELADGKQVDARAMVGVLNAMSSSPAALFLKHCSPQQKRMLAALVRCVRREGVPEISWRAVRADHDALTRSLELGELLSDAELSLVRSSLLASHAITAAADQYRHADDRRVALGMEIGEVGRVLMNEGEGWRRALAGT